MDYIKIADNKAYQLLVWPQQNKVQLKILGFWRNQDAVPNYLSDWRKAISYTRKGFVLLTDATDMKTHPAEVRKIHEQAQALIIKAGVNKVAEVIKDDIASMQLDGLAKTTHLPKRSFNCIEQAHEWLNEQILIEV